jgi:hypothetical protein
MRKKLFYSRRTKKGNLLFLKFILLLAGAGISGYLIINYWKTFLILAGIVLFTYALTKFKRIIRFFKYLSNVNTPDEEIHHILLQALKAMDDTHYKFNDENEANRELVSCLKMQGQEAEYQPFLGNGRTADATLNGVIIEGKLNPTQSDIDRLYGQISGYLKYNRHIHIVVYGYLDRWSKDRLQRDILDKYPKQVFLTYLEHPNRTIRGALPHGRK